MTNTVASVSQDTINNVLIDILKGAKDAGSEIYGASKTGIVKAVDFAQEQAPLVVQEFLSWKFANAFIWTIVAAISIITLLVVAYKCKNWLNKEEYIDDEAFPFIIMVACLFVSIAVAFEGLVPSIEQMVKVKVAPRVFIIEWVSDQIHPSQHNTK